LWDDWLVSSIQDGFLGAIQAQDVSPVVPGVDMEIKKYDPVIHKHVMYKEKKIK